MMGKYKIWVTSEWVQYEMATLTGLRRIRVTFLPLLTIMAWMEEDHGQDPLALSLTEVMGFTSDAVRRSKL